MNDTIYSGCVCGQDCRNCTSPTLIPPSLIPKVKPQMETQTILNIFIGLSGALGGYVLKSLNDSVKALQTADTALAEKVQHIELLVAGTYVKRDDLKELSNALFAKLDKIELKLDQKADK